MQGRADSGPSTLSQAGEGRSWTLEPFPRSEALSQKVLRSPAWGGTLEKGRLSQWPRPQQKAGVGSTCGLEDTPRSQAARSTLGEAPVS